MKYHIFSLMFFFLSLRVGYNSYAQTDLRYGYIVKINGDTIRGLVKYKQESDLYSKCMFKENKSEEYTQYLPVEIMGFGFQNGRVFVSNVNYLNQSDSAANFCEILIRGKVSEYLVKGKMFITDDSAKIYYLNNTSKRVVYNGRDYIREQKEYIGILTYVLRECNYGNLKLNHLKFDPLDIKRAIQKYYECIGKNYEDIYVRSKLIESSLGFQLEPGFSEIKLDGILLPLPSNEIKMNPDFNVGFKVFYNTELPFVNNRFSLQLEGGFKNNIFYYNNSPENGLEYYDVNIQYKKISGGLLGKYSLPFGFNKLYILTGVQCNFFLDKNFNIIYEKVNSNTVFTYYNDHLDFAEFEPAVLAGIGWERTINYKNHILLEGRYESGFGFTNSVSGNSSSRNIFLGIGFSRLLNNFK